MYLPSTYLFYVFLFHIFFPDCRTKPRRLRGLEPSKMVQINWCNKYTSLFHIRIIKYVNLLSILSPRWKNAQQKTNFKYILNFDTTFYTIQISFNLITKRNKVISFLSLRDYLIFIVAVHSGPENLKKSRQKTREIK